MHNSETPHKPPDRKILHKLPGYLSLVFALSSFALAACQKVLPPITTTIPNTDTVLTFIPVEKGVRVLELGTYQEKKIINTYNIGDAINAYEEVNDVDLTPDQAAKCADAIAQMNVSNLQPVSTNSNKPSSARTVLIETAGLNIPVETCGNLKTNSTPTTPPEPKPTQTSVPTATPPKHETEAPVNVPIDIGTAWGLCASILGLGTISGLITLMRRRKKPINKDNNGLQPVQLHPLPNETIVNDQRVIQLSGQRQPFRTDLGDGRGEREYDFEPCVIVADTNDAQLMRKVRNALARGIKKRNPEVNRGPVTALIFHEGRHAEKTSEGVAIIGYIVEPGTDKIIGGAVKDVNPNATPEKQREMFLAPDDPSLHDKRNAERAGKEMKKSGKK